MTLAGERAPVAEEQFRLAFENAAIGMALVATDGRFLRVNRALCDIVGYAPNELLARTFQDISHPDDLAADLELVRRMLAAEIATYEMDKRYFRRDGRVVWVQLNVSLVRDCAGAPLHFISQIQDITARRAADEALRTSEQQAQIASRMKSQFLANMSHEIRTPMNGVIGMADLLSDSALSTAQHSYVETLRTAADSLLSIINDILDLSKIEAGKIELDPDDFSLAILIRETTALFALAAETKGIGLSYEIDGTVRDLVRGDSVRLGQVLANLIGNAVKFTSQGGVMLRCSAEWDRVRFEIEDTGIGIPRDARARLMQPFEQADASTTRRFGGTGLGLAICAALVELMDGEISCDSQPGAGTTFTVVVPLAAATGKATKHRRVAAPPSPPASQGGRRRALLAEDHEISQYVACAMLERLGWSVTVVPNGQAAIDELAAHEYDIVILDCHMPVLDGYDAARAIRNLPGPKSRVPIVAMTASALESDRQRCLDAGMNEFIAKPITRAVVNDTLAVAIRAA